jgi:hypothetical protein
MIGPEHPAWQQLNDYVEAAIKAQPADIAVMGAEMMDSGRYRLQCHIGFDEEGRADPNTLTYLVQLPIAGGGGWATLCRVHHTLLGLPDEEVIAEAESVLWQHGIGIPDDASEITDT